MARTRLQAIQAAVFVYLPSILLSGFMFPFRGMPAWARGSARPCRSPTSSGPPAAPSCAGPTPPSSGARRPPVAVFSAVATLLSLIAYRRRQG